MLAVAVARQRLAADPQGAVDALAPHEAMLERVPEARRITREAHAEIVARQAARAREELLAARRELSAGDAASALARLDAPVLRNLGDEEHAAAEALREEAARIVLKEKRVADVGRLRRGGQLFEAREIAEALLAEAPPEERPRWEQEKQAIQGAIQQAFRVEIDREPSPFHEGAIADAMQTMMEAPVWLTEDGRTLVLTEGQHDRVWLQIVDVGSRTVRAEMVLRTPEPVGNVCFQVLGSTAWLSSRRGGLLAVDVERLTVELFRPAREIVPTGHGLGGVAITADRGAAGPRYHWVMPADKNGYCCPVQVVDLVTRRVVREVPEVIRLAALPGTREARIGCFKSAGLILYEDRGVPVQGGRFPRQDVAVTLATLHPSGEGLVLSGSISPTPWHVERPTPPGSRRRERSDASGPHGPPVMVLVDKSAAGPPSAPWSMGDLGGGSVLGLSSSQDTGLCAVTLVRGDFVWELLVVRPAGGTFERLHHNEVPDYAAVVRDAGARHLFLYSADPLILAPIGPTAPDLPRPTKKPIPWISDVSGAPACLGSAGIRAGVYRSMGETARTQTPDMIAASSRGIQKESHPDMVVERARALGMLEDEHARAEAQRLRAWLWERHPELPHVRLLHADQRALAGRWDEVREILAPCALASFVDDADHAQHFSHLLALAALHLGDAEDAARRLDDATLHHGSCQLLGLSVLLSPRPEPRATARKPAKATEDAPLLTLLVWAIHQADACLLAGDPEGALAALDPLRFDTGDEVQVLARRAEAWLALSPPPGRPRFVKIMALARLLQAHEGGRDGDRIDLPVPGAAWTGDRLDALLKRAAAWLEGEGQA